VGKEIEKGWTGDDPQLKNGAFEEVSSQKQLEVVERRQRWR
jgi:hypothetical protein